MDFSDSFDDLFPKGALESVFGDNEKKEIFNEDNGFETLRKIWSVSELLEEVSVFIDMEFGLVWVEGEIGQVSIPPSGHRYFSLKDELSSLKSVCFRADERSFVEFIKEGTKVLCCGRLNIYRARGDFQLIVDHLEPWGIGKLKLEFERLKQKLKDEGLFDEKLKKEIPFWPKRIFLITSPTGAAIRDFIKTLSSRAPALDVFLCPSKVQGEEACVELIKAIDLAEELASDKDVIVITRGGGSLEDLWVFNDEQLARRIFNCKIPVISAVGHEIDFTICDFVADLRAATPTAAAQMVCPSKNELLTQLESISLRLKRAFNHIILSFYKELDLLKAKLKHPSSKIIENNLKLDELERRLLSGINLVMANKTKVLDSFREQIQLKNPLFLIDSYLSILEERNKSLKRNILIRINELRAKVNLSKGVLEALNPLSCLNRGFALIYDEKKKGIIKEASALKEGQSIRITFRDGDATGKVLRVNKK